MDDAGPSNWEDNDSYSSHSDSPDDDAIDDDTIPQFIPNPNDRQSEAANMAGILYLLTLVEEEERGRRRIHRCPFTGEMKVDYYLTGHPSVIYDKVRMNADTFIRLSSLLEGRGLLHATQHMSVDAQLFVFLSIIAKGYSIRDSADMWQRSNETISRCFKNVLEAICSLKDEFIRPPDYNQVQSLIQTNRQKYLPWFAVSSSFLLCCSISSLLYT